MSKDMRNTLRPRVSGQDREKDVASSSEPMSITPLPTSNWSSWATIPANCAVTTAAGKSSAFFWLHNFRRLASRSENHEANFLGML